MLAASSATDSLAAVATALASFALVFPRVFSAVVHSNSLVLLPPDATGVDLVVECIDALLGAVAKPCVDEAPLAAWTLTADAIS